MVEERVQRRLAAIVAADVVGYSRLMGKDESGTLSALKALQSELIFPLAHSQGGRIVKTTGDGLLMEFPSVVDATQFAIAIQTELADKNASVSADRRIEFRIGVNLGDIIIDGDDIFGDGVNVAARLESIATVGGIAISSRVHDDVRDRIEAAFEDAGDIDLKNIARPVRVFHWVPAGRPPAKSPGSRLSKSPRARLLAFAAAGLVLLGTIGAVYWWFAGDIGSTGRSTKAGPTTASDNIAAARRLLGRTGIIVLPFVNQSGDASQEYFSDGITEDLISALARFSQLAVIARNAAFSLKGKAVKPGDIAREFGIRYIVEGSVRRSSKRIRVMAQLSDGRSGKLLWSQKYDEALQDIFAVQDSITRQVVGALAVKLSLIERQRVAAKATRNLDAYDLVLRGRELMSLGTRVGNRKARASFEKARQLDPQFTAAFAALGRAYLAQAEFGWAEDTNKALARALANARAALKLDPNNYEALNVVSGVHLVRGQYDQALTATDRALKLNPSNSESMYQRTGVLLWLGRIEEAVAAGEAAFAFDRNPGPGDAFVLAMAYYQAKRHAEAVTLLESAAIRFPRQSFLFALLAACYGQLGKTAEASEALARLRRVNPFFDQASFGSRFQKRKYLDYLAEGLIKAGLN